MKEVWQAKSWSAVLNDKPFVDVRETSGDILFEMDSLGVTEPHRDAPHWFLGWVGDDRPYDIDAATSEMFLADQALLKQGLSFLWYTIGHLGQRNFLPELMTPPARDRTSPALYETLADAAIYWLPEIAALASRLTQNGFAAGEFESSRFFGPRVPSWLGAWSRTLASARYDLPAIGDLWIGLYPQHQGDAIGILLEIGVIERSGDRFHVTAKRRRK